MSRTSASLAVLGRVADRPARVCAGRWRTPQPLGRAAVGRRPRLRAGAGAVRKLMVLAIALLVSSPALASELKIGLIPEQNVFAQIKRYEPIGQYIEETTGIRLRFTILSRYGNIIESFSSESMDGAFWGSFTGALAITKLGIEPVARPIWRNGTSTYHGYVFARKDSGIRAVSDMKGKSIAFVEKATTAGYVFPMAYLKENGVQDLDAYFSEYYFAGSHDATIHAVLQGNADVGCAKNTIYELFAEKNPRVEQELLILAESPRVPSNGLGLRSDLDPITKKKLSDALLNMADDPSGREVLREFGATRFIATTRTDYSPVFEIAERAGINVKEYHYLNE